MTGASSCFCNCPSLGLNDLHNSRQRSMNVLLLAGLHIWNKSVHADYGDK